MPPIPIIGRGIGSFVVMDELGELAHNDYVRLLVEVGILGLLSYLLILAAVFINLLLYMRDKTIILSPYLQALVCAAFGSFTAIQAASITGNILFRPAIQWYLWALIAIALKGIQINKQRLEKEHNFLNSGHPLYTSSFISKNPAKFPSP